HRTTPGRAGPAAPGPSAGRPIRRDQSTTAGLEVRDGGPEHGVRLVVRLPVEVPVPDLLGDHRETEEAEDLVEPPAALVQLAAGACAVPLDDLLAAPHPGRGRRLTAERLEEVVVVLLDPVRKGTAEVHQRVADGGHLPVEHTGDPKPVEVE